MIFFTVTSNKNLRKYTERDFQSHSRLFTPVLSARINSVLKTFWHVQLISLAVYKATFFSFSPFCHSF